METGTLQNVIEVADHRFAEDWPEDWDFTANSLKVVKVDQAVETKQEGREHARMYVLHNSETWGEG